MNLCSSDHEEICYEAVYCPLCEQIEITEEFKKELEDIEEKASILEGQVYDLKTEIQGHLGIEPGSYVDGA